MEPTPSILVTGATGLVGSHLLLELIHQPFTIYATKRPNSNLDDVSSLFEYYGLSKHFSAIHWINLDLTSIQTFDNIPQHIQTIYHTAAHVSFLPNDTKKMFDCNVFGTQNLLEWGRRHGISNFAFVSSIATIGNSNTNRLISENAEFDLNNTPSFYAKSKQDAEKHIWDYQKWFNVVAINPGIILGPCHWQKSSGSLFYAAHKGMPFYTLGTNGFIDVRDVAKALILLIDRIAQTKGNRYIAVSENHTYKSLFQIICKAMHKPTPKFYAPKLFTEIAWRLDFIKSKITKNPPKITKETAKSAHHKSAYSNALLSCYYKSYITIENAVANAANYIQQRYVVQNQL